MSDAAHPHLSPVIELLLELRSYLALPGNQFLWSGWESTEEALSEVDRLILLAERGEPGIPMLLRSLFTPTGDVHEVSLSSGWSDEYRSLASRCDEVLSSPPYLA